MSPHTPNSHMTPAKGQKDTKIDERRSHSVPSWSTLLHWLALAEAAQSPIDSPCLPALSGKSSANPHYSSITRDSTPQVEALARNRVLGIDAPPYAAGTNLDIEVNITGI